MLAPEDRISGGQKLIGVKKEHTYATQPCDYYYKREWQKLKSLLEPVNSETCVSETWSEN